MLAARRSSRFPAPGDRRVSRLLPLGILALLLGLLLGAPARGQLLFAPDALTTFAPSILPTHCEVADVDQDGTPDLITSSPGGLSLGPIAWRKGLGSGQFSGTATTLPDLSGTQVHAADLNGDGRRDLLVSSEASPVVQVALALPEGGFAAPTTLSIPSPGNSGHTTSSGDADGDGDIDVLVVSQPTAAFGGEARLFLNDGAGGLTLGPIVEGAINNTVIGGVAGAIDSDGEPDLVVISYDGVNLTSTVWRGQPGGGMQAGFTFTGAAVSRIADLDSDGDADLLAPVTVLLEPVIVRSYLGAADGSFVQGPSTDLQLTLFGVVGTTLADFDGDSMLDLAVLVPGTPPEAWMLRGAGTGGFALPDARVSLLGTGSSNVSATIGPVADFDGDGRLDVCAALTGSFQSWFALSLNRTYPPGSALLDLGHQLEGANGWPIQIASGSFAGGTPFSFSLAHGPVGGGVVYHIIGFSILDAPFKGGTMVPTPNLLSGPWTPTGTGALLLAGTWPMGVPSGFPLVAQFWFASSGSIAGFAASSGVLVTMP
jgi:hypothetical protein